MRTRAIHCGHVVYKGLIPGVYSYYKDAMKQNDGVNEFLYELCETRTTAERKYRNFALKQELTANEFYEIPTLLAKGKCDTSAKMITNYQVILPDGGKIKSKDFKGGDSNIADFLAIIEAIEFNNRYMNDRFAIHSTNPVAIGWVRDRKVNTKYDFFGKFELSDIFNQKVAYLETIPADTYLDIRLWSKRIKGRKMQTV